PRPRAGRRPARARADTGPDRDLTRRRPRDTPPEPAATTVPNGTEPAAGSARVRGQVPSGGVRFDAVYGEPVAGHRVVAIADPAVARLVATAHGRVHGRPAAVSTGGTIEPVGADAPAGRWVEPDGEVLEALAGAEAPIVLAGPGVVRDGAVADLHAVAAAASVGVLNTWGAKGV